jgi:hypothetical protein
MTNYRPYFGLLIMIFVVISGALIMLSGVHGIWRRKPNYFIYHGMGMHLLLFLIWACIFSYFGIGFIPVTVKYNFGIIFAVILVATLLAFLIYLLPHLWRSKTVSRVSIIITGINEKVFDLLRQALVEEGIEFKEMHGDFDLLDLNAVIYTNVWHSIGFATVIIEPGDKLPVLEKIVRLMKAYDKDHGDHFSANCMILQIVSGLVVIIIGLVFVYIFLQNIFT